MLIKVHEPEKISPILEGLKKTQQKNRIMFTRTNPIALKIREKILNMNFEPLLNKKKYKIWLFLAGWSQICVYCLVDSFLFTGILLR